MRYIWLVVWNIWIIFPYIGNKQWSQLTKSIIFQRGRLKPPTRILMTNWLMHVESCWYSWYHPVIKHDQKVAGKSPKSIWIQLGGPIACGMPQQKLLQAVQLEGQKSQRFPNQICMVVQSIDILFYTWNHDPRWLSIHGGFGSYQPEIDWFHDLSWPADQGWSRRMRWLCLEWLGWWWKGLCM